MEHGSVPDHPAERAHMHGAAILAICRDAMGIVTP